MATPRQRLCRGLAQLDLPAPPGGVEALLAYLDLLAKWNRVYNLTAVRDPEAMVTRHLLDSLAVLPALRGPRVLDVGTGAGLPGIPLAVWRPDLHFVLLDASAKKLRFVRQAVLELGLANVRPERARVEDYRPGALFDTVVSRAFASVARFVALAGRLCRPGGRLLAMKGERPEAELAALPAGYTVEAVEPLAVPGLEAARHLVVVTAGERRDGK